MFLQWCGDPDKKSGQAVQAISFYLRSTFGFEDPPTRGATDGQAGRRFESAPLQKHKRCRQVPFQLGHQPATVCMRHAGDAVKK